MEADIKHYIQVFAAWALVIGGTFTILFPRVVKHYASQVSRMQGRDRAEMRRHMSRFYNHPMVYMAIGAISLLVGVGFLTGYFHE